MTRAAFDERPTLIGHRGLGKGSVAGHAENTLGSFLAALDAGVRWLEVDVRRTLDDQLVVAHDAAIADGTFLASMSGGQASRHGILRLHELLEFLPPDVGVVFDVKSAMEDAGRPARSTTAALLARAAKSALRQRPVVALSFDPAALGHMRGLLPTLPLGLLTWLRFPIGQAVAAAAHLDVQVLAVHAGSLWPSPATPRSDLPTLPRVVEQVHASRRQLMVWCPTARQARSLFVGGVDALVVDDVPQQVQALTGSKLRASSLGPACERLGEGPCL